MENTKQEFKEAKKMKCKFCEYEWNTLSQMKFVSCPNCINKNEIENNAAETNRN